MQFFSDTQPEPLTEDSVHVWSLDLAKAPMSLETARGALTPTDIARADRFIHTSTQRRYTFAHAFLNTLIAGYLDIAIDEIEFHKNAYGKPLIVGKPLFFNLSHSDDFCAVAFAKNVEIGVDVEKTSERENYLELAKRYFHPEEIATISAEHDPQKAQHVFYQIWTRKEALIKATGEGLSRPLDSFRVPLPPVATGMVSVDGNKSDRFYVQEIKSLEGSVAALAAPNAAMNVVYF